MVQATRVVVYDVWIRKLVLHKYIQRFLDNTGYRRDCEVMARYLLVLKGMNSSFNGVWKLYACTIVCENHFVASCDITPPNGSRLDPEILRKLAGGTSRIWRLVRMLFHSARIYTRCRPPNRKSWSTDMVFVQTKLGSAHVACFPNQLCLPSLLNLSICIYVISLSLSISYEL